MSSINTFLFRFASVLLPFGPPSLLLPRFGFFSRQRHRASNFPNLYPFPSVLANPIHIYIFFSSFFFLGISPHFVSRRENLSSKLRQVAHALLTARSADDRFLRKSYFVSCSSLYNIGRFRGGCLEVVSVHVNTPRILVMYQNDKDECRYSDAKDRFNACESGNVLLHFHADTLRTSGNTRHHGIIQSDDTFCCARSLINS